METAWWGKRSYYNNTLLIFYRVSDLIQRSLSYESTTLTTTYLLSVSSVWDGGMDCQGSRDEFVAFPIHRKQ